jgi:hypothetical protein
MLMMLVYWVEVNAEKTKYMVMSWDQNAGQNNNIKTGNKSFERVKPFRYWEYSIHEERNEHIEIRECYYSVHNFLSSRLLSKDAKIKIHRTVILPVILCGCENSSHSKGWT